jgi:hypothetical protein
MPKLSAESKKAPPGITVTRFFTGVDKIGINVFFHRVRAHAHHTVFALQHHNMPSGM